MDDDLWGPSYEQVMREDPCCMQSECQYGLYYDYRSDVMEVNAEDEKSCAQVLRLLIAQADREIDELEKNMVFLQNELAWAECADWPDVCCNAIREKVNKLDNLVKNLREGSESDSELSLMMRKGPAERLHEILKTLLKKHCEAKDTTTHDTIVTDSQSDSAKCTAEHLDKNVKPCDSIDGGISKSQSPSSANSNSGEVSKSSLKIPERTICDMETASKVLNLPSTDVSKDSIIAESNRKIVDSRLIIVKEEMEDYTSLSTNGKTVSDSSDGAGLGEDYKNLQLKETRVKGSTSCGNTQGTNHGDEIENLHTSDLQPDCLDKVVGAARECSVVSSCIDLRDGIEKDRSMTLDSESGQSRPAEVHLTGIIATTNEPMLNLSVKSPKLESYVGNNMNLAIIKRPSLGIMQSQKLPSDIACLNKSSSAEMKKRTQQHRQREAGEIDVGTHDAPIKRIKKSPVLPIAKATITPTTLIEFPRPPKDSPSSEIKNDNLITESCSSSDLGTKAAASPLPATGNLKDLKMCELRAIAKAQNLTNYYKLKKNDLVQRLTNLLESR